MRPDDSIASAAWLAVRSLVWAIALPGVLAGYVPWRFFGVRSVRLDPLQPVHLLGLLLTLLGTVLLGMCIWEFARRGRGTLAPVDAPRQLVVQGLYRYVRNPMYLSVTIIVFGELALTHSSALLVYWTIWFAAVNLFVIGYEEPALRRRFGTAYEEHTRRVSRWVPRRPRG